MNYFKISEFVITNIAISLKVADKILLHHIIPLNQVRDKYGNPIYISRNSGFRPYRWERNHGRDGTSEHVFRGKGAVDLTVDENIENLVPLLEKHTNYNRIALYTHHNFIHCDYGSEDGGRYYFEAGEDKEWKFIREL